MPNENRASAHAMQPVLPSSLPPAASDSREREQGLLRTITALRQELQRLREAGAVQTITRERMVEPPDYQEVKRANRLLRDENQRLRCIIDNGHITYLADLIDRFISQSRDAMRPITEEIFLSNYDKSDMSKVQELLDYLRELQQELGAFLAIQQDGLDSADGMAKRQIHQDLQRLFRQFSNSSVLDSLSEDRLATLHLLLEEQRNALVQFFQPPKKKGGRAV